MEEMIAKHAKALERRINKMIRNLDAYDDGRVSFEEIQNEQTNRKLADMLNKLKDDADGFISAGEF